MTDESHLKNSEEIIPEKPSALEEDAKQEPAEKVAEGEQGAKHDAHHPRKAALTKREIMEALSRERFP
jgi:hypothetical protein